MQLVNQKIKETFSERHRPSFLNHSKGLQQESLQIFLTPNRQWKAYKKTSFMAVHYGSCLKKSFTIRKENLKAPPSIVTESFTELAISLCTIWFVLPDQKIGYSQVCSSSKADSGLLCCFCCLSTIKNTKQP